MDDIGCVDDKWVGRTYMGKPCIKCGGKTRYRNGDGCVSCNHKINRKRGDKFLYDAEIDNEKTKRRRDAEDLVRDDWF